MDAGVTFGKAYGLKVGVALSAQQMALLTSDMVWLVEQSVTLPDGSTQKVLVPQVYARVKPGDLDGSGALLATIAGRDLNSISTLGGSVGNITFDRPAGIYVQGENGTLGLQALHDVNLTASQISNSGAGSKTQIVAGNDINLNTLTTTHSESSSWGKGNDRTLTQRTEVGSQINGGGDVALAAGRDLTITTADETRREDHQHKETKSGLSGTGGIGFTVGNSLLKTTDAATTHSSAGSTVGSTRGNVTLSAGNNLTVKGSDVLAAKDLSLSGSEVNILAAENNSTQKHVTEQKQSGLTLALSGTLGSAINTAVSAATSAREESTAEQYVSTYDGMKIVATAMSPVLGTAAVNKLSKIVKEANNYPSGISFNTIQPAHLAGVDGFTQKSGISGGHNANAFYDAAKQYNVKVVSETPMGTLGIKEVKYQIPTKDRAGNLTGSYKPSIETKTIYDPKVFTDEKMLELGQQASAKGYKDAMASKNGQATAIVGGVSFRIYVDKSTGTVRNFHPN